MSADELLEIEKVVGELTPEDQMRVIERLVRQLRRTHFTDHAADERNLREMASDPDIQREMNQLKETARNAAG